jgi:hypothetical protein
MFPDLISRYYEYKSKGIKRYPCHTNRASSLGSACERELVYDRTSWEQAELHDVDLQVIFDEGNVHEAAVLKDLAEAGLRLVEQQSPLEWREYQITAHPDAVVVVDNLPVGLPLDVKSMSPHIWDGIFRKGKGVYTWEEVGQHFTTKPWLRKYCAQITIYALLKNCEHGGILVCKNKGTGALAQVNIPLDLEYGEQLLKRAERINRHVQLGTLPDRIPWDEDVCGKCKYLSLCLPERVGKDPLVFLEDSTVEAMIDERARLEESGKEYDKIDTRFKEWAKARPETKILIGKYLVTKKATANRTTVKVDIV